MKVKLTEEQKNRVIELACAGGLPVLVGEYRGGRVEPLEIRSKVAGGASRTSFISSETIEVLDSDPVVVRSWLPDGAKPEEFKPAAAVGSVVLAQIRSRMVDKGAVKVQGKIIKL